MQRTRHNNRGVAYQEYLADVAKEQAESKAAADAAQEAADASNPELQFKRTADAEAEHNRQLVLFGVLNDEYLQSFGTIVRQPFNEAQVRVAMNQFMAEATDYIKTPANAKVLVEFLYRNNLSPAACDSYRIAHKLLTLWNGYPDLEKPVAQPVTRYSDTEVVDPRSLLTPSDRAVYDHQQYCEKIIGHDEDGKGWTMQMVDALPSKEMLRLLRLFEQGHRGSNLLTVRREILDIKAQQDAERERIAAEGQQ